MMVFSGSPVYNQKAEIIGVFSGYDREQRLAVISPESEHKSYSKNI
jgi:hypothetical protein